MSALSGGNRRSPAFSSHSSSAVTFSTDNNLASKCHGDFCIDHGVFWYTRESLSDETIKHSDVSSPRQLALCLAWTHIPVSWGSPETPFVSEAHSLFPLKAKLRGQLSIFCRFPRRLACKKGMCSCLCERDSSLVSVRADAGTCAVLKECFYFKRAS